MDLNAIADRVLADKRIEADEVQSTVHPDILFKYNSVNLIIGLRGSGKTYMLSREILKLCYAGSNYSQVYYVTNKKRDDTFAYVQKHCTNLEVVWCETKDAMKLINTLTKAKACISNEEWCNENPEDARLFRQALNAEHIDGLPHTFIIFDDCIGLFSKQTPLSTQLFQNRQARITYALLLQDVSGLSPSMKANIDTLVLFGAFPKHKFNILMYQMPIIDGFDWSIYESLSKNDYILLDYITNEALIYRRPSVDILPTKNDRYEEIIAARSYNPRFIDEDY